MAPVFSGEWRLRRHSRRAVNHPVRSVDDPLAVLMLDALDVPETRKDAGRYVKQAARAVLDQRPAAARLAHDPIPQHFSDDFGSLAAGAALGMVPVVSGEAADAAATSVFSRAARTLRRCGRALPHVRLRSLQMIETLAELGQLGTRPARRRIKIGFQRRDLG